MSLRVSEVFFSTQCEGVSTGIPAIFIRLTGCNLMCGGPGGSLMKQGKATWWCDTEAVWKLGNEMSNDELIDKFKEFDQGKLSARLFVPSKCFIIMTITDKRERVHTPITFQTDTLNVTVLFACQTK